MVVVTIGFAEALSAPEVTWSLVDAGFKVIAFSRRGRRGALRLRPGAEIARRDALRFKVGIPPWLRSAAAGPMEVVEGEGDSRAPPRRLTAAPCWERTRRGLG